MSTTILITNRLDEVTQKMKSRGVTYEQLIASLLILNKYEYDVFDDDAFSIYCQVTGKMNQIIHQKQCTFDPVRWDLDLFEMEQRLLQMSET